jgi:hypothetical protein
MLDLANERRHSSNWRPQLLRLPSWPLNNSGMYASPLFGAGGGAERGGGDGDGGGGRGTSKTASEKAVLLCLRGAINVSVLRRASGGVRGRVVDGSRRRTTTYDRPPTAAA